MIFFFFFKRFRAGSCIYTYWNQIPLDLHICINSVMCICCHSPRFFIRNWDKQISCLVPLQNYSRRQLKPVLHAPAACLTQTDEARTVDKASAGNVLLLPDIKIQLFFFFSGIMCSRLCCFSCSYFEDIKLLNFL